MEKNILKYKNAVFYLIVILIIVIGLYLRIDFFLFDVPMWWDEISLSFSILNQDLFDVFVNIEANQKAPVLFVFLSYLITLIGGISNHTIRFIPFLSGIMVPFVTLVLSFKFFHSKIPVIFCLLLISFNPMLICYSNEFKPYSSDVLIFLLVILFYDKVNFENISLRKIFLVSFILFLVCNLSFPAIFSLFAIVTMQIFKTQKLKNPVSQYFILSSELSVFSFFKGKTLKNILISVTSRVFKKKYIKAMLLYLGIISAGLYSRWVFRNIINYEISEENWQTGFLNFSFDSLFNLFDSYYRYINVDFTIGLLFLFSGIVILILERNKYAFCMLLCFIFVCIASILKIYPIYERVALYLFPMFVLFMAKPLDIYLENGNIDNKIKSFILSCLMLFSFLYSMFPFVNVFDKQQIVPMDSYAIRYNETNGIHKFFDSYKLGETVTSTGKMYDYIKYYNKIGKTDTDININCFDSYYNDEFYSKLNQSIEDNVNWIIFDQINENREKLETIMKNTNVYTKFYENEILIYKLNITSEQKFTGSP